jgi:hypothetical protein
MDASDERDVAVLQRLAELRTAGQEHVTLEQMADGLSGKGGGDRTIGPVGGKIPAWLLDTVEGLVIRGLLDSDEADWTYIRAKPDGVTDWPALTLTVAAAERRSTRPPFLRPANDQTSPLFRPATLTACRPPRYSE